MSNGNFNELLLGLSHVSADMFYDSPTGSLHYMSDGTHFRHVCSS